MSSLGGKELTTLPPCWQGKCIMQMAASSVSSSMQISEFWFLYITYIISLMVPLGARSGKSNKMSLNEKWPHRDQVSEMTSMIRRDTNISYQNGYFWNFREFSIPSISVGGVAGIILCMHSANERRRYIVSSSHWLGACTKWFLWLLNKFPSSCSLFLLWHGWYSSKYLMYTPYNLPLRVRYGLCFMSFKFDQCSTSVIMAIALLCSTLCYV